MREVIKNSKNEVMYDTNECTYDTTKSIMKDMASILFQINSGFNEKRYRIDSISHDSMVVKDINDWEVVFEEVSF